MNIDTESSETSSGRMGRVTSAVIAVALLVVGAGVAAWFLANKPKAKPRERPKRVPIVEVAPMAPTNAHVRIEAMGTVVPADEAIMQPEVSGRIVWVHPDMIPGGSVTGATMLVKLDDRQYRLNLERQKAALRAVLSNLRLEEGQQDIAKKEWDLVNGGATDAGMDRDLALRVPQLEKAQADVASARAAVGQAELDLERSSIRAPFDAVVIDATADVGDQATPGTVLGRLAGIDEYWVKASVRTDLLKWLRFPGSGRRNGSTVRVHTASGGTLDGDLYRLLPELDTAGRMAQILVTVPEPLAPRGEHGARTPLLLNQYVRVEIAGTLVKDVVRIPRSILRDGSRLWLLDPDQRLRIVPVQVLWGTTEAVFAANSFSGEARIITSHLGAPVEGMTLSTTGDATRARDK